VNSMIIIRFRWFLWRKNSVFSLWVSPSFRLSCDVLFLDLNFYFVAFWAPLHRSLARFRLQIRFPVGRLEFFTE
jgi:hypothetical protein